MTLASRLRCALGALVLAWALVGCDRAPTASPAAAVPPANVAASASGAGAGAPVAPSAASTSTDAGDVALPEPLRVIVREATSVEVFRLGTPHAADSRPLALGERTMLGGWPIVAHARPAAVTLGALLLAGHASPEVFRCAPKVIVGLRFARGADVVEIVLDACPRLFATYVDASGKIRNFGTAFQAPSLVAAIAEVLPADRELASWSRSLATQ